MIRSSVEAPDAAEADAVAEAEADDADDDADCPEQPARNAPHSAHTNSAVKNLL